MSASAELVKSWLVCLVRGRMTVSEVPRPLSRLAKRALRNARGGRAVSSEEADDLVQDLLMKVLALRSRDGGKLAAEWESMSVPRFAGYLRSMLKNLAVDSNPLWNRQRSLRAVVEAALSSGLPAANGMPTTVERAGGGLTRPLVAAACAELMSRGVAASAPALTTALMAEFSFGVKIAVGADAAAVPSTAQNALDELDAAMTGEVLAKTFLAEVGLEGRRVLLMRGLGFAEMARRLNLALSTAHVRYGRIEATLKHISAQLGASREAVGRAIELLSLPDSA
jgi:DNA-directed RNA polymerase specialized sigma24 family protein